VLSFESPMFLGPVAFDSSLKVLMEFVIQPELLQQSVITLLEGKIFVTLAEQQFPIKPLPFHLTRQVNEELESEIPPSEIVDALSRLKLYRLQEQARLEVTAGDYDQASEHLHRLATHLLSQGERGLARTALMEADHILKDKSFSQQGRKEIKYGTRALLMSGRRIEDK
jgi:Ca-activated chloride channel family protein